MQLLNTPSLDYKDVNLISVQPSKVESRTKVEFLRNRIVNAPMLGILTNDFIYKAIKSGMSLAIPRLYTPQQQVNFLTKALEAKSNFESDSEIWFSVGIKNEDWKKRLAVLFKSWSLRVIKDYNIKILLDVANSYSSFVKNSYEQIEAYIDVPEIQIYTGNVHSTNGFVYCGYADAVRVGIGNGSACLTTGNTGIGRGQLTCIKDATTGLRQLKKANKQPLIIADGGIRSIGDISKAFGAGAHYVMMGYNFAHTAEAASNTTREQFVGGASRQAKSKSGGNPDRFVEGQVVETISLDGVESYIQKIEDGVTSAISYSGFDSLTSFIGNGTFELRK